MTNAAPVRWELVNMTTHISRLGKGSGVILVLKRER